MNKVGQGLAFGTATLCLGVGSSLILHPPQGQSAYVFDRLNQMFGDLPVIGLAVLFVGVFSVIALVTRTFVRTVFGLGACAFTALALALGFAAVFAGGQWAGAFLSGYIALGHLLTIRWASRALVHEDEGP